MNYLQFFYECGAQFTMLVVLIAGYAIRARRDAQRTCMNEPRAVPAPTRPAVRDEIVIQPTHTDLLYTPIPVLIEKCKWLVCDALPRPLATLWRRRLEAHQSTA